MGGARVIDLAARIAAAGSKPDRALVNSECAHLVLHYRAVPERDFAYVRGSFAEGHKGAPGVMSMNWKYYKRYVVPELERVLRREGTELLGAYQHDGEIVGWLAFHRGRRASTIHWAHTRYRVGNDGPELRRRGIFSALLDRVDLGARIAYTFKGAYPKHRSDGQTLDEKLLPWLSSRGQHAAYIPWDEWSAP